MNAFITCEACDGRGFLAQGLMPDRTYLKCAACNGIGQRYIDVVHEMVRNQGRPMPDPVVF